MAHEQWPTRSIATSKATGDAPGGGRGTWSRSPAYVMVGERLNPVGASFRARPLASGGKCAIVTPPNRTLLLDKCHQRERERDRPGDTEHVTTATVRPGHRRGPPASA